MTDIYDQHKAAFASVSAFVILDATGERVATVAIKFPRDGAARLYAYVHLIGTEMVRGHANGYGYDKRSAAVDSAISHIKLTERFNSSGPYSVAIAAHMKALKGAALEMNGNDWTRALEKAGFRVVQAV